MASAVAFKKEKEIVQAIDIQLKELNQIFKEQSKCLDDRCSTQMAVLELAHDFLRKWADIEGEHAQKMEKLVKSFANKEKSGNNGNISISVCLLGLFSTCGKLGKMYQQLADAITQQVVDRLQVSREESQLVRKVCSPVLDQCQESIRRYCQDAINSVKPYHSASTTFAAADSQWKEAHAEMNKNVTPTAQAPSRLNQPTQQGDTKAPQIKKQASVERKAADKLAKREGLLVKVNEERNRHISSLSAANAALNCYNTEILPKYIRAMDYCSKPAICTALQNLSRFMAETAERAIVGVADELKSSVTRCHGENDVALMAHYAPKLFTSGSRASATNVFRFNPLRTDEPGELIMPPGIRDNRKLSLTNMNNENSKKLAAIIADLERWEQAKWQLSGSVAPSANSGANAASMFDSGLGMGSQIPPGTIENYAQTLKQYSEIAEQIARNEYELALLNSSMSSSGMPGNYYASQNSSFTSPQRGLLLSTASTDSGRPSNDHMISSSSMGSSSSGDNLNQLPNNASRTPVFGGSIEDHLNRVGLNDSTNLRSNSATPGSISVNSVSSIGSMSQPCAPPLPQVVVACVQYISKFGLRQQGVFRINGSQIEISDLKSKFERNENPLGGLDNPSSVNAAASVLKSYFRQLREPLLLPSTVQFDHWIQVQQSPLGMIEAIRTLINKLPPQIRNVAAFLFVFLNRVSELSSENMMDAYNLAVCFAPCLLPTPNEAEQMQHFNTLAAIIKTIILNVNTIFSPEEMRLYDDVVNGKPAYEQISESNMKVEAPVQSLKTRKGSLTDHTDGSTPATAQLTRQFRTLANIDPQNVAQSPTTVRALSVANQDVMQMMPDDAEALFNFTARNGHELSLRRGERMRIVRKLSDQWWEVTIQGRGGLVPANYLRLLTPAPSPALSGAGTGTSMSGFATSSRSRISGSSQAGSEQPLNNNSHLLTRQASTSSNGKANSINMVGISASASLAYATSNSTSNAPTSVSTIERGSRIPFNNETNGGMVLSSATSEGGGQPLWMRRQLQSTGGDQNAHVSSAVSTSSSASGSNVGRKSDSIHQGAVTSANLLDISTASNNSTTTNGSSKA